MENNTQKIQNEVEHFQNPWICQLLGYQTDKYLSWICFPRYPNELRELGILNDTLWVVYEYVRLHANEMGDCVTSADTINNKVFKNKVKRNYINKLLRELRELRLIYFEDHGGVGGNVTIKVDDFFLPNGQKTNISKYFVNRSVPGEGITETPATNGVNIEASERVKENIHRSTAPFVASIEAIQPDETSRFFTGNNTNTNNETNTINIESSMSYKKETGEEKDYAPKLKTESFDPEQYSINYNKSPYEISQLKKIAQYVADPYMGFILIRFEKLGFGIIQDAYTQYLEDENNPKVSITSPAKYFNAKITKLYMDKQKMKIGSIK